ncbi:MAG: hypothetical protein K9H48_07735 [Melioribacteraceae bacterium]|nr:hypothetical protein [Melioribacteraceae bacterium]
MRELIQYKCQYCGQIYSIEKACKYCENNHIKKEELELWDVEFTKGSQSFPHDIYLKTIKDGKEIIYRYQIDREMADFELDELKNRKEELK